MRLVMPFAKAPLKQDLEWGIFGRSQCGLIECRGASILAARDQERLKGELNPTPAVPKRSR